MIRRLREVFVFAALGLALLAGGCALPSLPRSARPEVATLAAAERSRAERNLAVFERVWGLVAAKHYEPRFAGVDWSAAAAEFAPRAAAARDERELYRVLNEMLEPLHDSHTHALRPDQVVERRTEQRVRAGFRMVRVEQRWVVSDVLEESPAARAGVRPGWIAVSRNGEPLPERPDFRAAVGEELRWEFLDPADRRVTVSTRAERLTIGSRRIVRELDGGIVYLRFDEFAGADRRWLNRQLKEHRNAPGVVIDLRWNGGGDTVSLGIAIGEFFGRGVDCGTFVTRSGKRREQTSWQLGSADYRGRVVVLVDAATASAAEIFSAVMQAHGRATVIGRKTAGAVLASLFYHLPDGGELQLSRFDYVAPGGRRLEGAGLVPDVVVERTLAEARSGRDRDLEAAVARLRAGALASVGRAGGEEKYR